MKAKIIFVYTIVLIITFQSLQGQKSFPIDNIDIKSSELCLTGELFTPDLIIDGTTYFNSEWLPGEIYLSNGEIVINKLIKYNGLLDELFWKEPKSNNVIKLDKEAIRQFHFQNLNGDSTIYFRKIKVRRNAIADSSEIFGQVVYGGSLSLFLLHTYKTAGSELIRKNGVLFEKVNYVEVPVYIFRLTNNNTFVFKSLNRKRLYSISPANSEKINEFLKTNRTRDFKDISYLRMLTRFLSQIVNE
jgi:hypothetical protein